MSNKTVNCWKCGTSLEVEVPDVNDGSVLGKAAASWMAGMVKNGIMCDACSNRRQDECMLEWIDSRLENGNLKGHEFLMFDWTKGNSDLAKWIWRNRRESLFIAGGYGVGKTRCSVAAAGAYIREASIVFFRATALLRELHGHCGKSMSEAMEFIRSIERFDILIIDDFGKEKLTEKAGEMFFDIIDHRYSNASTKRIWITTNLSGQELEEHLGEDKGPAIMRRLREICIPWGGWKDDDKGGK